MLVFLDDFFIFIMYCKVKTTYRISLELFNCIELHIPPITMKRNWIVRPKW